MARTNRFVRYRDLVYHTCPKKERSSFAKTQISLQKFCKKEQRPQKTLPKFTKLEFDYLLTRFDK